MTALTVAMDVAEGKENVYSCLKDGGENVHIATKKLAEKLSEIGYEIVTKPQAKKINTAGKDQQLQIDGYVRIGGVIEWMAICYNAHENLISVVRLTNKGISSYMGPTPTFECELKRGNIIIAEGTKNPKNQLFYIDIRELISEPLWQANMIEKTMIRKPSAKRKVTLSKERIKRVYDLHERCVHRGFGSLAAQIKGGQLINADCDARDIEAVHTHYGCLICELAKANKKGLATGSHLKPHI